MTSRLGWYFKAKRLARGLSIETLAAFVGYRNLKKGTHRILRFEHDGQCPDTLLINLADALGINYHTILDIMDRDTEQPTFLSPRIVSDQFRCPPMACRAVVNNPGPRMGTLMSDDANNEE